MSTKIKELREKAAAEAAAIQKLAEGHAQRKKDGKTGADLWPGETEKEWESRNKAYDEYVEQIKAEERDAKIEARSKAVTDWRDKSATEDTETDPGKGETFGDLGLNRRQAETLHRQERDRSLVFSAWARRGIADPTREERAACERLKVTPAGESFGLRHSDNDSFQSMKRRLVSAHPERRERIVSEILEQRALSGFLAEDGGVLVPSSLVRSIEIAMIEYGAILQVAETMITSTGEPMGWPMGDDTDNEGSYTDENTTVAEGSNPDFEAVVWSAYDITSKFINVPYSLLRDAAVNLETVLGAMIGERIGRKLSGECTTGAAKIRGIVTRAAAGATTAGASAIVYNDVVNLEHSVDPAYRQGASFMFHDNILMALRKLLDSQNRPLWISNIAAGYPDTFNGRPYAINQKMDSAVTTTKKTMLFGQLKSYKVRIVGGQLRVKRLVERYAEKDQIALIGYTSADGNLLRTSNASTCPVKYLIQA